MDNSADNEFAVESNNKPDYAIAILPLQEALSELLYAIQRGDLSCLSAIDDLLGTLSTGCLHEGG